MYIAYVYLICVYARTRNVTRMAKRFRDDGTHNKTALCRLHYEGASIVPFRCMYVHMCRETKHDKEQNTQLGDKQMVVKRPKEPAAAGNKH